MKRAAYILTILMLCLTIQPILVECQVKVKLSEAGCGAGKCCSKKENNNTPENKDNQRSTGCNPFASCSQCQYIAVSKFLCQGSIAPMATVKLFTTSEDIESGYIADCWHPPESDLCY